MDLEDRLLFGTIGIIINSIIIYFIMLFINWAFIGEIDWLCFLHHWINRIIAVVFTIFNCYVNYFTD